MKKTTETILQRKAVSISIQPVMLVCSTRLTFFIVVLSFEAFLTVVTSAKPEAGVPSGSDRIHPHATKNSRPNRNKLGSSHGENSTMTKNSAKASPNVNAKFPDNSDKMTNATATVAQSWTGRSVNTSKSKKKSNADNNDKVKDNSSPTFWTGDVQVGCKELRARSYITDGFCTSEKPVQEVVCAGNCLPIMDMPWYAEFVKTVARTKLNDWQCVEDVIRKKRVKLLCKNGSSRHYRIKVVKSCKCKKITNKHNKTSQKKKRRRDGPPKTAIGS